MRICTLRTPVPRMLGRGVIGMCTFGLTALSLCAIGHCAHAGGSGTPASAAKPASHVIDMYATYYGWYTNTPPGCATAYSGCAHGTGGYSNPITLASDAHELAVGTILYYPTVEKYFVMGDDCQECDADWAGDGPDGGPHLYHVDLWIGGRGDKERAALDCEDALTRSTPNGGPKLTPFVVDPPPGEPVTAMPLFDSRTGRCFRGASTVPSSGRLRNLATRRCLDDPSTAPGAPPRTAPCGPGRAERVTFRGAFLAVHGRCLQVATSGSRLAFAPCDGGPRQEWEIGADGSIAWIQHRRCVAAVRGSVVLRPCTGRVRERWAFEQQSRAR